MSDAIIGLVLDRSGSMRSMWDEAVAGYNRFKNEQAEVEGKAFMLTTYFDERVESGYDGKEAKNIPDLSTNDSKVYPRGMTALIDATINNIERVQAWLNNAPDFDGKVFIVVITDGRENASQHAPTDLKSLVEEKENAGWEFIYLAANVNTEATSKMYGFNPKLAMTYDNASVGAAYNTLAGAVTRSRTTGQAVALDESERDVRA